jgi:hypothetical protein
MRTGSPSKYARRSSSDSSVWSGPVPESLADLGPGVAIAKWAVTIYKGKINRCSVVLEVVWLLFNYPELRVRDFHDRFQMSST